MNILSMRTIILSLLFAIPIIANAAAVEIDGIYYNLDSNAKTAEVTHYISWYKGDVIIPKTVEYYGITYNVTSIGDFAFASCSDLTSVTIPNSVTNIGDHAFSCCNSLTSISIPNSVTTIGDNSFLGCDGLTSVMIPNSVTAIGEHAFSSCDDLTSVIIGNRVNRIGDYAFYKCNSLDSIKIPNSVTSIGNYAFDMCYNLSSVTIGNNVTRIGDYTFDMCHNLSSVTIGNSVITIGKKAFYGCSRMTSIIIPNSVTSIEDHAFDSCRGLTSITIPNSVTTIGESAFEGCSGFTSVTIGNGVKNIYSKAFSICIKLKDFYCYADEVPTTCSDVFQYSSYYDATLHVPESALGKYTWREPWSSFKYIVSTSYNLTYVVDGEMYKTYKLAVGSAISPEPEPKKDGYTFSGWSTIPATMPEHDVTVYGSFVLNTTTYLLYISATGNGSVSYNNTTIRNKTSTFTVNEGTNATITFSPDNGYRIKTVTVGGTDVTASVTNNRYTVSNIKNNTIVGIEFEAYNTYTPGDVNNDGSVSVTDVGCAINYILEQVPSTFVFDAADMNGDKSVSVTDVGMIINFILSEGAGSRKYGKTMEANHHDYRNNNPNISLVPTAGSNLELKLEDKDAFIGFQFDVEDAEGAGWHGACPYISMQLSDGDDHVLTSRQLSNGKWRVVCYSLSNSSFSPNSGASLLTINTERNVSLSDIRLTTAGFDELRPAAIVSTPTGIASVEQGVKINAEGGKLCIISDRNITLRLYSLGGSAYRTLQVKKGVNSFDGLRSGLYMINNKKIILR